MTRGRWRAGVGVGPFYASRRVGGGSGCMPALLAALIVLVVLAAVFWLAIAAHLR